MDEDALWASCTGKPTNGQFSSTLPMPAFNSALLTGIIRNVVGEHLHQRCTYVWSRGECAVSCRALGAQQGDPLDVVLFCVAMLPLLLNLHQRRDSVMPAITHIDDINVAPDATTSSTMRVVDALRSGLDGRWVSSMISAVASTVTLSCRRGDWSRSAPMATG